MSQMERGENLIDQVCSLPRNKEVVAEAKKHGLDVVNVMWEDTARTAGSAWGANITDMTLQVKHPGAERTSLLPVLRQPNFRDITADVAIDKVRLKVGNHAGQPLEVVSLKDFLADIGKYLSDRSTLGKDSQASLVTDKDTHVLVSAQACVLPIPSGGTGTIEFNPVLYNYQSRKDSPAVLTIMLSPEGTSITAMDNTNDKAEWGQNVYFNNNGQKTALTGQRLSAYKQEQAKEIAAQLGITAEEALDQVKVADDINMVIVLQVPIKHEPLKYRGYGDGVLKCASLGGGPVFRSMSAVGSADFEDAVISHGEDKGKHFECGGYKLERDIQFPIRATVQFYKVSDSANLSAENVAHMAACIQKVYADGDYVGSLVDGSLQKGEIGMGQARPTQPAPQKEPVLGPPVDHLDIVSPFGADKDPKAI